MPKLNPPIFRTPMWWGLENKCIESPCKSIYDFMLLHGKFGYCMDGF